MKKWILLDTVKTREGKSLSLWEHDGSYTIRVNGLDLMSTRQHTSEERLAELACARLQNKSRVRVLIGGLGFGFTLKRTLSCVPRDAKVVVAEMEGAVIRWNLNSAFKLAAATLAGPRVELIEKDVGEVIREQRADKKLFDAILLDVDNGPSGLSHARNKKLYLKKGIDQALKALQPEGCLAVWSASPDPAFVKLMGQAGFNVEVERCKAHVRSGSWHWLFIGRVRPTKPVFTKKKPKK